MTLRSLYTYSTYPTIFIKEVGRKNVMYNYHYTRPPLPLPYPVDKKKKQEILNISYVYITYRAFCGPTLPSLKDELAVRSLSGINPLSMPSGAMH